MQFVILTKVIYSADKWVAQNMDFLKRDGSRELFESSSSTLISHFAGSSLLGGELSSSTKGGDASSSFLKRATVAGKFAKSMESLERMLRSTQCSFIRCVKPNASLTPERIDTKLVSEQLRSLGILQTCEVLKAGFPTRLPHSVLLGPDGTGLTPPAVATLLMSEKDLCFRVAIILRLYGIADAVYRVGKTRVFFRAGQMSAVRR